MLIRSANVDDARQIAQVHVASWRETYQGIVPADFLNELSLERRADNWMNILSDPNDEYHRTFVAEVDHEIIGFSNYGFHREENSEYKGELFAIYLLKSAQMQGIGRALFQRSISSLLNLHIGSMLVWVLKDNPSRGFYEKLGGEYVTEKSIDIGGKPLMGLHMVGRI
jgi:GNAT superfamily N-acetyltransferase